MAGIGAVAASKTHVASGADVSASGFIANERVALSATPAGSGYAWSVSAPSDSRPALSDLNDDTDTTPSFTPDVAGFYVVSVLVDGVTLYVLRLEVAEVGIVRPSYALNLPSYADSQVPTPSIGVTLYYSTTASKAVVKDTSGTVTPLY